MKSNLKERVIELRRAGLTYSEIMAQLPVAKSTISDWLHSVGLAKHQIQRITEKRREVTRLGAEAKHRQRIERTEEIINTAKEDIGEVSQRELWLMGVMLYWAEGSKEKKDGPGSSVTFTNMDPTMIYFFLHWLENVCGIYPEDIIFEIYLHETHKHRVEEVITHWAYELKIPREYLSRVYFKKANIKTKRKNVSNTYFGVMRLQVRCSANLNRKIAGWAQGVVESIR
jgi:hypothetical protein